MASNKSINFLQSQIENVNINTNSNEEKPVKNVTLNWLSGLTSFSGRQDQLKEINELFRNHQMVVIHGAPGIGKTETTRHFGSQHSEYFNGNLIWINSETPENIKKDFQTTAETLDLKVKDNVSLIYARFQKCRCLFVFDNAEDMSSIGQYLPPSHLKSTVHVLITSQYSNWEDPSIGQLHLEALPMVEAQGILRKKITNNFDKYPLESWNKLIIQLEGIPLSIQIVSSIIYQELRKVSNSQFNLEEFINNLGDSFIVLNFPDSVQNFYNKTVLTSIYSALDRLKTEETSHTLQLLSYIAYLNPDYIEYDELFLFSTNNLQESLTKLFDYSLIQYEKTKYGSRIKVHRTIQLALRQYDLDEQNGLSFKTVLKTLIMDTRRLSFHQFFVLKYIQKEEFKQISVDFYVENKDLIHDYFLLLARNHCDEILKVLLPKFKNKYNKFGKYSKIFTLFSSGLSYRVEQYYKLLNKMLFEALENKNDNMDTILLLTEYGARIEYSSKRNETNAFHYTPRWLSVELFDYLLENNDAQNIINSKAKYGRTILHLLVTESHEYNSDKTIKCMDHLISKWNADISIQDNLLNNILHIACVNNELCIRMLEYLMKKCNCKNVVNVQNGYKLRPIQILIRDNDNNSDLLECVIYLIEKYEADITLQDKDGWNTLFYVCRYEKLIFIDSFLRRINCQEIINIQDKYGDVVFTLLMYNLFLEEYEIIELMKEFIKIGMDFKITNKKNKTLVDIAKERKLMRLHYELNKFI